MIVCVGDVGGDSGVRKLLLQMLVEFLSLLATVALPLLVEADGVQRADRCRTSDCGCSHLLRAMAMLGGSDWGMW